MSVGIILRRDLIVAAREYPKPAMKIAGVATLGFFVGLIPLAIVYAPVLAIVPGRTFRDYISFAPFPKDVIDAIPSSRTHFAVGALIPSVQTNNGTDVGGTNAINHTFLTAHGGRTTDQRITLDGLSTNNAEGASQFSGYLINMGSTQELTVGFWNNLYKGSLGRVTYGAQYAFLRLQAFPGAAGPITATSTPNQGLNPNNQVIMASLRYYPF